MLTPYTTAVTALARGKALLKSRPLQRLWAGQQHAQIAQRHPAAKYNVGSKQREYEIGARAFLERYLQPSRSKFH
jgi:hypothetical protein